MSKGTRVNQVSGPKKGVAGTKYEDHTWAVRPEWSAQRAAHTAQALWFTATWRTLGGGTYLGTWHTTLADRQERRSAWRNGGEHAEEFATTSSLVWSRPDADKARSAHGSCMQK
ncbi:hypothetical protein NDU88_006695 [Pleurodeles waltl]|uniref:Uncharacterized protein n=1 Tax=Pleurodeles waltl TaxID=8319 RepID=A0AAV7VQF6_PLEWA|nr:hypothetical protein NDU88_006695 [Pleurodeles waltl]